MLCCIGGKSGMPVEVMYVMYNEVMYVTDAC